MCPTTLRPSGRDVGGDRKETGRAYLEFEPNPVRFRHVEKLDELGPVARHC